MALIKCPDCGKMFSEFAECCPQCGCPVNDAKAESGLNQMKIDAVKIEDNASLNNDTVLSEGFVKTESDEYISTEPIINESKKKTKYKIIYLLVGVFIGIGLFFLSYTIYTAYTSSAEKKILQRAEYIVENLPDHRWFEEADNSVFSDPFRELIEKGYKLEERTAVTWGGIGPEIMFYWLTGQDGAEDDGLKGMSLLSKKDTVAYVEVIYRNFGDYQHIMKLVYNEGQWYCDDFDDNRKVIEETLKDYFESKYGDDIDNHSWGENEVLHHDFVGIISEDQDSSIELKFDCIMYSNGGGRVKNAIYKHTKNGEVFKLAGKIRNNTIYFNSEEGKDITLELKLQPLAIAGDGEINGQSFQFALRPLCVH